MVDIAKNVKTFALAAFTLLGVLFGMMIMAFIFAQIGNSNQNLIDDVTTTVTNRTGAFINTTTYTIPEASNSNFTGGFTIVEAVNATDGDGTVILAGNYTVDAAAGTIVNASVTTWPEVNITYTINEKTSLKETSEDVQNNSLQAIVTYTNQSSTQMSTLAIAITLVILIAVFLLFWMIFVGRGSNKNDSMGGSFG